MPTPKELTERFIRAYNSRDRVAIRAMLAPVLDDVRPGGTALTTPDEVMAQYERDGPCSAARVWRSGRSSRPTNLSWARLQLARRRSTGGPLPSRRPSHIDGTRDDWFVTERTWTPCHPTCRMPLAASTEAK